MTFEHKATQVPDSTHLSFVERRELLLSGDSWHYLMARGDQLAFAAEVVRFGFAPNDFSLNVERLPRTKATESRAASFEVTVENIHCRRRAIYRGGPGRAWVANFLEDLLAGKFGEP